MEYSNMTMLKVSEIAKMLNVTRMTVYRWIQSGELKSHLFMNTVRVDIRDLNEFIEKSKRGG